MTAATEQYRAADWIGTSGQLDAGINKLAKYSCYPKEITGKTVWRTEQFASKSDWTYVWNDNEIELLEKAARDFHQSGVPLEQISPDTFKVGEIARLLASVREEVVNGRGFILFKGLPVDRWDRMTSAIVYLGIGTYLGNLVCQNGKGHLLGHVKNLGEDAKQTDKVRIYRTSARQFFHTDASDIVGLLCLHRAKEGGESDIVSTHHVFNVLQNERPDVLRTLIDTDWYWDRKGEISPGQNEWFTTRVIQWLADDPSRVYLKWDPYNVKSLERVSKAGKIPPLSEAQLEATQVLEDICARESLHMILEVGDIQLVANTHVLHARTSFIDADVGPRRHLLRLWMAIPEKQGGWRVSYADSNYPRRGGIVIKGVQEKVFLEAE